MNNHQPKDYKCPLCLIKEGVEGDYPYTKQADIFYKDVNLIAIIASHGWITNKGHVLIFPVNHFENIYDIPEKSLSQIYAFSKRVAIAMKEVYKCEGITLRQNNEPAGDQDVFHFHLHVFPRYSNDNINQIKGLRQLSPEKERARFASILREYFTKVN